MEREFKIGDRVRYVGSSKSINSFPHPYGTVVALLNNIFVGVQFEFKTKNKHSCLGNGKPGYCLYVFKTNLRLVNEILSIKEWKENLK